jgi:GTP-binding protein Era
MKNAELPADGPPTGHRSGFVGLIGKPNVGKSTILNAYLGQKVSITSPRPQTTRRRILGILTRPEAQILFVDSPGWHRPQHPLGRYLLGVAKNIAEETDLLVTVLDATTGVRQEDEWVFEEVRKSKHPALLAINKVDLVKKGLLLPIIERCASLELFDAYVPVSAVTGENMEALLKEIVARLPEGPRWYEPGQVTDQTPEQAIREFIREQVLLSTREEVPHAVDVLLDQITRKPQATVIHATILVEREGQKAILIGRQGRMLKQIGTAARQEIERLLSTKVFLELWVKVVKDWRQKPSMLRELGYHA